MVSEFANFAGLTATDKGARIDGLKALLYLSGDFCAGACGQRAQLGHRLIKQDAVESAGIDANDDGALRLAISIEQVQ